ncbi:MAG: group II intron reverse transcriptase/maturase [Candidatus Sericytochromatia bacterium]|nr:group II intron reverse transcriptase/maturase [Candidatus Tanganyikabacteria bacterium]
MDTSRSGTVYTRLQRIAELARNGPEMVFTTLGHHIDAELLAEAWRLVRKDGAVGVDGRTAADYEQELAGNLQNLLDRFKSGTYHAPPVRRVHIPKGDGTKTRPIGIPTIEDKVLQKAVAMVLEAVYEQDFLDCSYGFRPGRSAHDALERIWHGTMAVRGGWIVDLDISSFFDSLSHSELRTFLDRRVRDGVLRRTIDKWLKAGVMEAGQVARSETGTPQGGVISPLLANIYLHEVLDTWFLQEVQPRLRGESLLVRYADDAVIVCALEEDARRLMDVLPKRFARFGLTLHPEKTRLVRFVRPSRPPGEDDDGPQPGTFAFLGFTHFWGRSQKGGWVVTRKTAKDRFSRAIRKIAQWCRVNRHLSIPEQQQTLARKLRGHDAYYGIAGNIRALQRFRWAAARLWRKWLARRGGKERMTWERFARLLERYPLPLARVVHSVAKLRAANP